jgi:hypothetical protein
MKTTTNRPSHCVLVMIALSSLLCVACNEWNVPNELVGTWTSRQVVRVRYTLSFASFRFVKDSASIVLTIRNDRTVEGQVGGATFEGCTVAKNRGTIARTLDLYSDYIIVGKLLGSIFPQDSIASKNISIPFNVEEGSVKGTIFQNKTADVVPMVDVVLAKSTP